MNDGRRFEIVVAGAGPVGLLFAFRLARERRDDIAIRVLDGGEARTWQRGGVDPRVYALSRESQRLLAELWDELTARRVSPYRSMRVCAGEPGAMAEIRFDAADIGESDLGHIVEDNLIRTVIAARLQELGIEVEYGVGVERIERGVGRSRVTLADGTTLAADLVVGADGTHSRVRQIASIAVVRRDYVQRAIVTHVTTERPHDATAWQRFLPGGPLAFLPLADGRSSIVWTNADADAGRLLALDDADFLAALETASAGAFGRLGPCTPRRAFPLALQHAVRYSEAGIALIGDAAHAVHPLAGQGMNLGMRDAAVLARTIVDALSAGEHAADDFVLRRYARAQKGHNLAMQLAFDGLNDFYARQVPGWIAPLRGLGMRAVDGLVPAKRLLMRRALGLDRPLAAADRAESG